MRTNIPTGANCKVNIELSGGAFKDDSGAWCDAINISTYKENVKTFLRNPDGTFIDTPEYGEVVSGSSVFDITETFDGVEVMLCHEPTTCSVFRSENGFTDNENNWISEGGELVDSGETFEQPPVYWYIRFTNSGARKYSLFRDQPFALNRHGLVIPHMNEGNSRQVCYGSYGNQLTSAVMNDDIRHTMDIMHQFFINGTNMGDAYGEKWKRFAQDDWMHNAFRVNLTKARMATKIYDHAIKHYPEGMLKLYVEGKTLDVIEIIKILEDNINDK